MKTYFVVSAVVLGLASPAFAADSSGDAAGGSTSQHFAVIDTVGNCSVLDSKPAESSGMKVLGDSGGYSSASDATKAFGSNSDCKATIQRG